MPSNAVGSIDITKRCNLRCEHCYFFAEEHKERELTPDEWIEKLEAMKAAGDPMMLCTWVGGEPLVRKKLIETGRKYFKHNTVVTNGTMELPDWTDVTWVISIDGTEEAFAKMRAPGIYQQDQGKCPTSCSSENSNFVRITSSDQRLHRRFN